MSERFGNYVWLAAAVVAVTAVAWVVTPDIAGELTPWAAIAMALALFECHDYHRQWRFARALDGTTAYVRSVRVMPSASGARALLLMSDGSTLEFHATAIASRIERRPGLCRVAAKGDGWAFVLDVPAGLVHGCCRHMA